MKKIIYAVVFFAAVLGIQSCGVKPPSNVSQEQRDNLENSYDGFKDTYNDVMKDKKKKK